MKEVSKAVNSIGLTSQLGRTGHDDIPRTKMRALPLLLFLVISPLMLFYAYSCPLCILNTLWNIIMIFHSYVEQDKAICRVKEKQLSLSYYFSYFSLIVSDAFCVRSITRILCGILS